MITRHLTFTCLFLFFNSFLQAQCYNLVWQDEFDGAALDLSKWEYQTGGGGWGNSELQYYTAGDNLSVSSGTLKITAEEDTGNVYAGNDYTSSRIRSRYQGDWRYGKMEASIKLPVGQGIWPAFWMMPSYNVYGTWPSSGEIDIMEYLGHQLTTTYATCHYGNSPSDKGSSGGSTNTAMPLSDAFHTFSVEWEPTQIRWYLDGTQFHTTNSTDPDFATYNWPFDQQFHFILNLAVGGQWPGPPDGTTVFPQVMEVDWVRVYQALPDIEVTGALLVEPGTTNDIYTLPDISGATYNWSVPTGASIMSGQTTNQIAVQWGNTSGDVSATIVTACGTESYAHTVEVSPNLWMNYDFEDGDTHWSTNEFNGAAADFDLTTMNVQQGATSMCVTTNTLTANRWDIQLGRSNIDLLASENYTISFWAKADANGKDANFAIIYSSNYAYFTGTNFLLTDTWAYYSYSFTAPATASTMHFNFDLGDELGTFCFDDFSFARSVLLPVEYTDFWATQRNETVEIHWITAEEEGLAYFDIQRSQDLNNWESIDEIPARGSAYHYQTLDEAPFIGKNYYRFKSVDLDGRVAFSEMIAIDIQPKLVTAYPNPFDDELIINGNDIEVVQIYNLNGQLVKSMTTFENKGEIVVSTQELLSGIYIVHVFGKQLLFSKRFVKN